MTTNQRRLATAMSSRRQSILVVDDDDASGFRESPSIGRTERKVVLAASCILGYLTRLAPPISPPRK
jgi:hypothetical protein